MASSPPLRSAPTIASPTKIFSLSQPAPRGLASPPVPNRMQLRSSSRSRRPSFESLSLSPIGSPDQSARPTCKRQRVVATSLATQRASLAMITFNTTPPSPMQSPVNSPRLNPTSPSRGRGGGGGGGAGSSSNPTSPSRGRSRRCSMDEIQLDSINEEDDLLVAAANLAVKSRSASRSATTSASTAAHHAAAFFEYEQ